MFDPSGQSPFLLLKPTQIEEKGWPLEKTAFRLLQVALLACPFWWVIDSCELIELDALSNQDPSAPAPARVRSVSQIRTKYDLWRARWVVGSLVLLILVWLVNPVNPVLQVGFAVFAGWRLWEILTTGFGTSLAQEQQIRARSLVTIAVYALQVTLIFAILYHSLASGHFTLASGHPATGAFDYLYASWSNFTSLGSAFEPRGSVARFLAVLTTTTGIILLGVLLALGIDTVKNAEDRRTDQP